MIYYFKFETLYDEIVSHLIIYPDMELKGRDLHKFIIENYNNKNYNDNLIEYENELNYSYEKYKDDIIVLYSTTININNYNIQYN